MLRSLRINVLFYSEYGLYLLQPDDSCIKYLSKWAKLIEIDLVVDESSKYDFNRKRTRDEVSRDRVNTSNKKADIAENPDLLANDPTKNNQQDKRRRLEKITLILAWSNLCESLTNSPSQDPLSLSQALSLSLSFLW
ncbi:hypothetical protein IEQ34_009915 [Dendrobium chrysotoxum]|uniref:Uncharacterized protein n=1 Tax=Dendrobium chrysotoxum TaxID=161865 RepID=A0AAV7H283_DENCH|nr:hypothetical protein IEQ34_009915 [Dendrobium chrysotoxum]